MIKGIGYMTVITCDRYKRKAGAKARQTCERDCLQFYQILDKAIGEHN